MAEVFIAVAAIAVFVALLTFDVYGKARAFERGTDPKRPPETVTSVELPPPRYHDRGFERGRKDG